MNMPEGSTTLNVPELRRLHTAWVQAATEMVEAGLGHPMHRQLLYKADRAWDELAKTLANAAPALLDAIEAAQRYDSGIPGHAIKDFISGEHEPYCAACALHAALTRLAGPS